MLVLPLIVDRFNNRVRGLQGWFTSRPGIVCDGLRLVKMGWVVGVPRCVICLPGQSQTGSQDQKLRRSLKSDAQRRRGWNGGRHDRWARVFSDESRIKTS